MFDISSQLLLKLMRKWRITIVKIYGNEDQISKHHYGPDFLCFFDLWVWEFSVKRWQLICLKTLLRFSFISCFKSTIFVIVCLLIHIILFCEGKIQRFCWKTLIIKRRFSRTVGLIWMTNITKYNLLVGVYS